MTSPFDDLLAALHRFRDERKTLLIVLDVELYEACGNGVRIVEADHEGRNLLVEGTFGDRMRTEISQLDLKAKR
jgi:hypothetical protein